MNFRQHTDEETAKKLYQPYRELYRTGKPIEKLEVESIRKDGTKVIYETSVSLIRDSEGKPIGFRGVSRDVTERKQIEETIRHSEQRYRTILDEMADGYFEVDLAGNFIFVNDADCLILGYSREELLGASFRGHLNKEDIKTVYNAFSNIYITGKPERGISYRAIRKDGTTGFAEIAGFPLQNEKGETIGFRGIGRDITERKRAEDALLESEKRYRELSIVDDLTQLYNSRHFYFQLKIELDRSNRYEQPLTLLLLDLDNFKAFNDAYGHVEGDQVLWRLGQVVKRCLRETDFAYRYGGEEFTIILPMTTSADGAVTAERIRTEFKKETFSPAPGQDVHVTVSIGLAQYKPQEDMKAFVHRVDQLMYQGKKNGKDRICSES
jgi:diguanylate cyclase (GGDEF)-like protein/PAS domain S-box-containing protein